VADSAGIGGWGNEEVLVVEEAVGGTVRAEEVGQERTEVDESDEDGDEPSPAAIVSMSDVGDIAYVVAGVSTRGLLPSGADERLAGGERDESFAPVTLSRSAPSKIRLSASRPM
jgi:hypothetical protein